MPKVLITAQMDHDLTANERHEPGVLDLAEEHDRFT